MNKKLYIVILGLALSAATAMAIIYDESDFSAGGRMYEPAPEEHQVGKDNGDGQGFHHPGEDCGLCHKVGGRAEKYLWTMAGTLYKNRSGTTILKGGEVIMEDRDGNVISMTSNRAGNFWTEAPIASDPYTVSNYHGHEPFSPMYTEDEDGNLMEPADPDNPKTWHYKTWLRKGKIVRTMMTIGGIGGSPVYNRMSCNMHHGGITHRSGALWVGRNSTLPSYPAENLSYRKHIYPILRSNCAPCHIPGKSKTSVNTKTDLPPSDPASTCIDYSGGLDLMTYQGSAVEVAKLNAEGKPDGTEIIKKIGVVQVVDTSAPSESILLVKTLNNDEQHGGGKFWSKRSADYIALKQWIAEGAENN